MDSLRVGWGGKGTSGQPLMSQLVHSPSWKSAVLSQGSELGTRQLKVQRPGKAHVPAPREAKIGSSLPPPKKKSHKFSPRPWVCRLKETPLLQSLSSEASHLYRFHPTTIIIPYFTIRDKDCLRAIMKNYPKLANKAKECVLSQCPGGREGALSNGPSPGPGKAMPFYWT